MTPQEITLDPDTVVLPVAQQINGRWQSQQPSITAFRRSLPVPTRSSRIRPFIAIAAALSAQSEGSLPLTKLRSPKLPAKGVQDLNCYEILGLLLKGWQLGSVAMDDGGRKHIIHHAEDGQYADLDVDAFNTLQDVGWILPLEGTERWEVSDKGKYWFGRYINS